MNYVILQKQAYLRTGCQKDTGRGGPVPDKGCGGKCNWKTRIPRQPSPATPPSVMGFDDLHMVVVQQIPGGVIELRHSHLEIDLGLNEIQLRLGQPRLRVQNEKHRLGAQLVLAFVGAKSVNRKALGHFCRFHGKFGFLEGVNGGGHVERDALIGSALLILVAAAANQGVGKTGLGGVPPNREKEGEGSALGRIGKVEALAEAAGQSNVNA